tara:strand:- start:105 stop:332 length:228 start_codon:yes stop_codon:yes gene_type:complete
MKITRRDKVKTAAIAIVFIPMILLFHYGAASDWRPNDWTIVIQSDLILNFVQLIALLVTGVGSLFASIWFYDKFK